MAIDAEDAFQKELIDLFVQEAQEWLQQVHVALDELQQGPPPDRHLKLAQTITAGLTNLAGSAATIGLEDVERSSFAALPFVEAVRNPAATISANDFLVLCKQLGHIHTALTRATGMTFEAEGAEAGEAAPVTMPADELLAALQRLDQEPARPTSLSRRLVGTVITQIQSLLANGVAQCDVKSLREFLGRQAEEDEAFWVVVQEQVPRVTDGIARLKRDRALPERTPGEVQALQELVGSLWTAAQQVNAGQAMTFFMGLHSVLAVALQRRVTIAEARYAAIESRLGSLMEHIQSWMDAGRAERAAVGKLLPADVSP